ncbi:MAG: GNAT family N-acetyltransferase [Agathobacter sp.]
MKCYLREAIEEDVDLLFQWANDPVVRQNSFSTKTISYQEHVNWFFNLLSSENCKQYIYLVEDVPVGQVRITIVDGIAEIGYSVCEEKRSQGHGNNILLLIKEKIENEFPMVSKVVGKVKPENIASQKAFLDAGYREAFRQFEIVKE